MDRPAERSKYGTPAGHRRILLSYQEPIQRQVEFDEKHPCLALFDPARIAKMLGIRRYTAAGIAGVLHAGKLALTNLV